ncbi:MAG: rhamnulokinase [Clostridia bacterium]|nr:rhamnulokinase [Clostridia bacterium]
MKKMLSFDFGASSGRAILGTLENGVLKTEEMHRFSNDPVEVCGVFHWDVLRLFYEIKQGILKCVNAGHTDIDSIGIDTWGVDVGFLDDKGRLIGNPVHYRDSMTDGIIEKAFEVVPAKQLYGKTGIQFMKFNTLFQLHAMNINDYKPYKTASKMLFMPDLLNYLLTGEMKSEYSIASTSQMLDPEKRDWQYDILESFEINKDILCEIVEPGTIIGRISKDLADKLGCGQIPVVAVTGHDTASAVVAVPAEEKNNVFISCGTWSLLGVELDDPILDEAAFDAEFTNEGGAFGKIRFLKNIIGLWLNQECKRHWENRGIGLSFGEMADLASKEAPFRCFIDPSDDSFMAPKDMPQAVKDYCAKTGQNVPETQGQIVRCIVESLALKYRNAIENLEKTIGRPINTINMVGGGIKDTMLCRFTAEATGRKVVAGPTEGTAIGNLLIQAYALGEVKDLKEIRDVVRNSVPLEVYEPANKDAWDKAYEEFLRVTK